MKLRLTRFVQLLLIAILGAGSFLAVGLFDSTKPVHALPEYASRTGEACATCHVNPGGGGPRTLRGLLWAAQGRPDQVPGLANVLLAPNVSDGLELYDIACSACHGSSGEGLFGIALTGSGLKGDKISSTILRGRERSGMPSFEGRFTEKQIETLVQYVVGLSTGKIDPPPVSYPLESAQFGCVKNINAEPCGGN